MPYFVYVLLSERDKKLYVGCSKNPKERLTQHNCGKVSSTKDRRPLVHIYTEEFEDKAEAFSRERFLKSLWGAKTKKNILKNYLENQNKAYTD